MRRVASFFWSRLEQIGFLLRAPICCLVILWASAALAQNMPIYQTGPLTPGHALRATTNGVAQDAGGAQNGNLTEMGITNTGLPSCVRANDPASGGYRLLCVGANATVGTTGAPSGGGGAVVGPASSTVGNCAVWANTVGTLLSDGPCPGYINPQDPPYNCKGDGVTDDTACFQAALTAAGAIDGTIEIFQNALFYITAPLSDRGAPVIIHGNNPTNGNDNGACASGFTDVAGGVAANINLLTLNGTGSKIDHVCFLMGVNTAPATAGAALTIGAAQGQSAAQQSADFNVIKFPYIGIAGGGATGIGLGGGDTNSLHLTNNWVVSPKFGGILIGQNSNNASTTSVLVQNDRVTCVVATPATYGIAFFDAAIDAFSGNEENNCDYGTAFIPGAVAGNGQVVLGEGLTNVIGDSSQINNLLIKNTSALAHVIYLTFVGWWASMNTGETGPSVLMDNTVGGLMQNISLTGGVSHGANNTAGPQNIIDLEGCINGVTLTGNIIAADGAGGGTESTGIFDNDSCFGVTINGNNFVQNLGTLAVGLHISSAAGNERTVVGNNFHTATVPLQVDQTAVNFTLVESGNSPLATNSVNITPSGAFASPLFDQFAINGSGPVNNMTGWWQVREVRMRVNTSGFAFQTGGGTGGFCEALTTSTSPQIVEAWWNPNLSCWDLK